MDNTKYFLYFIIFLSATNVLGYLVSYKFNSAIIFMLIGLIMHQFSKNLVIVLLVALVITNMLAVFGIMREGLDGSMKAALSEKKETKETNDTNNADKTVDPEVETAITAIKDKVKKAQNDKKNKDHDASVKKKSEDEDEEDSSGLNVNNELKLKYNRLKLDFLE